MKKRILIKNIKELVLVEFPGEEKLRVSGKEMDKLQTVSNAWLAIEGELIAGFGSMADWEGITDWTNLEIIDAEGKFVIPAFCDSHTHIVYSGNRENEWVARLNGKSYEEIANEGGGIINSALKLRGESEEDQGRHAGNA